MLESSFWATAVYQDLTTHHDWPVKHAIVVLPIEMKGNSKHTFLGCWVRLGPRTRISAPPGKCYWPRLNYHKYWERKCLSSQQGKWRLFLPFSSSPLSLFSSHTEPLMAFLKSGCSMSNGTLLACFNQGQKSSGTFSNWNITDFAPHSPVLPT